MKVLANKQVDKLFDIEVIFSGTASYDMVASKKSEILTVKQVEDIVDPNELNNLYRFLDSIDYMIDDFEDAGILTTTSIKEKLSDNSKLSAYWQFYFNDHITKDADTEYLIDFGISTHKLNPRTEIDTHNKVIQESLNNLSGSQKFKFERVIVNGNEFKTYRQAFLYVRNYIIELYRTYKIKYQKDDFIQRLDEGSGFDRVRHYIIGKIKKIDNGKYYKANGKALTAKDIFYSGLLDDVTADYVDNFEYTITEMSIENLYDYIDEHDENLNEILQYLEDNYMKDEKQK